jgi:hypothetical protein
MVLLEIVLGHANTSWEFCSDIKLISLTYDSGCITPFMQNVVRRVWNCCSLRNKSTQNGQCEEIYGEEDFRDATAYAKSLTVGNWAKLYAFLGSHAPTCL